MRFDPTSFVMGEGDGGGASNTSVSSVTIDNPPAVAGKTLTFTALDQNGDVMAVGKGAGKIVYQRWFKVDGEGTLSDDPTWTPNPAVQPIADGDQVAIHVIDSNGDEQFDFTTFADSAPTALSAATGPNGTIIDVLFSDEMDPNSGDDPDAWLVYADSFDDPMAPIGVTVLTSPPRVRLQLDAPVTALDTITLDYAAGADPVRNVSGEPLADFSGFAVENTMVRPLPQVWLEALQSIAYEDQTIPSGERHGRCVAMSDRVILPDDPVPSGTYVIGPGQTSPNKVGVSDVSGGFSTVAWSIPVGSNVATTERVVMASDDATIEQDEEYAVSIPTASLVNCTMQPGGSFQNGVIRSDDVALPAPIVTSALFGLSNGYVAAIYYDSPLDTNSVPALSAFSATVNGAARSIAARGILPYGTEGNHYVWLQFAAPVDWDDTGTASYVVPGINPIRGANGVNAGPITDAVLENILPPDVTMASSVAYNGVTYNFSEPRPVMQYPSGDYRVLAPVTITSTSIPSAQASGVYTSGSYTFTDKWAHGMQVNPGRRDDARSEATGNPLTGLVADNYNNPKRQGFVEIPKVATSLTFTPYDHSLNVDPGATGQSLEVTGPATLYKAVSRDGQNGRNNPTVGQRPAQSFASRLIVVDDLGPDDALPPGTAQADKTHYFTERDWDVSVFPNIPRLAGAETVDAIVARLVAPWPMQAVDNTNSSTFGADDGGHDGYARAPAMNVGYGTAALVFDYSDADKKRILNHLYPIAIDTHERVMEGGVPSGEGGAFAAGNGSPIRKPALSMVLAALEDADTLPGAQAKIAAWKASTAGAQFYQEDIQIKQVTPDAIYKKIGDNHTRPVDQLPDWTEGAYDYSPNAAKYGGMGTNWDGQYRTVTGEAGVIGVIAAMATAAAKDVWARNETFEYFKTYLGNEKRFGRYGAPYTVTYGGVLKASPYNVNALSTSDKAIIAAILPSDPVAPAPEWAKVKGNTLWVHFDKNLDEGTAVAASSYTVKKNGVTVSGVTIAPPPPLTDRVGTAAQQAEHGQGDPDFVPDEGFVPNGIWRSNIGLILPTAAVAGDDEYTLDYVGGSGATKLRSVLDNVNVAAFSGLAVENITEPVAGSLTSYPIVHFSKARPDRWTLLEAEPMAPEATPYLTLWIPHIKLAAYPASTIELHGYAGGTPGVEVWLLSTGAIRVYPRGIGNATSAVIPLNTATSVRIDIDATDANQATAWNAYLNGAVARGANSTSWSGGPGKTIDWTNTLQWTFGGTGGTLSSSFDGELGGWWLHNELARDPAQVARFTSKTNGSLDIGPDGSGITGTPPPYFLIGNAAQWNTPWGLNRGTGPRFFKTHGGVTDVVADQATWPTPITGGTPAPAFTTQPSISPSSGTAGTTLFTANDGVASNASSYTRRWLLDGAQIGTGATIIPSSAGSLVLEVTASGAAAPPAVATSASRTVSAAAPATVDLVWGGDDKATRQWIGQTTPLPSKAYRKMVFAVRGKVMQAFTSQDRLFGQASESNSNFRFWAPSSSSIQLVLGSATHGAQACSFTHASPLPVGSTFDLIYLIDGTQTTLTTVKRIFSGTASGALAPITITSATNTGDITGAWASDVATNFPTDLHIGAAASGNAAGPFAWQQVVMHFADENFTLPTPPAYGADWGADGSLLVGTAADVSIRGSLANWNSSLVNKGTMAGITLTPRRASPAAFVLAS